MAKRERLRVLKENAEGTYKTKHAEAARLNYTTTTHRHTQTQTHLVYPKAGKILRKIGRGGDPGVAAWAEEAIQVPSRAIRV